MEPRRTLMGRVLGNGGLELILTGGIVAAPPLYALAAGTAQRVPALAVLGVALTYIGIAIAGAMRHE